LGVFVYKSFTHHKLLENPIMPHWGQTTWQGRRLANIHTPLSWPVKVRTTRGLKTKTACYCRKVCILALGMTACHYLDIHATHFFELLIKQIKLLLSKFITARMSNHCFTAGVVNPLHCLFECRPLHGNVSSFIVT